MSRYFSALIFGAALFGACNFHDDKDVAGENDGPTAPPAVGEAIPGYLDLKAEVFDEHCKLCHGTAPAGNSLPLTTYAQVKAAIGEVKEHVFDVRDMPPSGAMTAEEKALLKKWIDAGAPEMATTSTATATSTAASFTTDLDDTQHDD